MTATIIAIANQKGGVGKTTTAVNLAAELEALGFVVALVDIDPQANASAILRVRSDEVPVSAYTIWVGATIPPSAALIRSAFGVYCIPGDRGLAAIDSGMIEDPALKALTQAPTRLRDLLATLPETLDFILIDCPPGLGPLMSNALTAAAWVLIPFQCDPLVLEGLDQLLQTIDEVRAGHNPRLQIAGIVLTMTYDGAACTSVQQVLRQVRPRDLLETQIGTFVRLKEMSSRGPIRAYGARTPPGYAYARLAQEVLHRVTAH